MTVFALKKYQTATLAVCEAYLETARIVGAKPAFDDLDKVGVREPRAYRPARRAGNGPLCLPAPADRRRQDAAFRPTVKIAADAYLEREFPIVLWLVPTNTIRAQTLETLKKPGNPNYETLRAAFDGRFRVFDIADFVQITPADLQTHACVIVGDDADLARHQHGRAQGLCPQ